MTTNTSNTTSRRQRIERALIDVATAWQQTGAIDGFVERARQLGARHREGALADGPPTA